LVLLHLTHVQELKPLNKTFSKVSVSIPICPRRSGSNLPRVTPKLASPSNHHRPQLRLRQQPRLFHRHRWFTLWLDILPMPVHTIFKNKRWAQPLSMALQIYGPILWPMEPQLSSNYNCINKPCSIQPCSNSCQSGHFSKVKSTLGNDDPQSLLVVTGH